MQPSRLCRAIICTASILMLTLFAKPALAQYTDWVDSSQIQVLADTGKAYWMPEANLSKQKWISSGNKWFTFKLGASVLVDYTHHSQDSDSKMQVGDQEDYFNLRSGRLMARGNFNFKRPWSYLVSFEYKGWNRPEGTPAVALTDLKLVVPLGKNGDVTLGKIKETFVYEMIGDAANLPHQERLLSPFFKSRNYGVVLKHYLFNDRMTLAGGWFNSGIADGPSVNTFTGRVTALPKWENNGKAFMHTALAFRYTDDTDGTISLKGKNETAEGTDYVSTGAIDAKHQWNMGIEQLWSMQNFSVLVEYVHNWTKTPTGNEQFQGYYVTGSWVISGEERPYDKRAGYARRIKPDGKGGAIEIVGRVASIDLNSRNIEGGINNKATIGVNWWATQYWKMGCAYGISNLVKDGSIGVTNSIHARLQWIF